LFEEMRIMKAIVLDIDGTLLTSEKKLSELTKARC
jgi:hydroxymethylpyrimidine pyrophosphatase-like HAD family hydrolase